MKKVIEYAACNESFALHGGAEGVGALYSADFVGFLNRKASAVSYVSDYINEIFMHFYLRVVEVASILNASGADEIVFKSYKGEWPVHMAAAKSERLNVPAISTIFFYFMSATLYVASFFLLVASALTLPGLVLLTRRGRRDKVTQEFSVIRSPASYDKMRFLNETRKVAFYYDDIFQKKLTAPSMYSFGSPRERFFSVLIVPFLSFRDFFSVMSDASKLLGWGFTGFVLYYFSKRIAHKCVFEYYLNFLIKQNGICAYYTGNKEDRFAILEKRLCKKYAVHSVCVPHGIEYAFKTPAGLVGDIFYCTTEHARQHLSNLYGEQKFIYDENVARQMFSRRQDITPVMGIVFFPESRDAEVNLTILGHLLGLGYEIAVKLHPKDSLENYKDYADKLTFVSDFDSSISNKICLARKSTVLVEAIYNNSIPISVLTDPRDRGYVEYMLPSLTDDQIMRVYSFEELACVLAKFQAAA
ncbi:hypothetical protein ID144_11595 [Pseudomonas sp. JM0905a]|uniref:hypothetical protein n=1 Tax=Pseudomonas sp. JM0905a TaxID=2772484 RepID=UPI0016847D63|nr:hypothetical protein [Pseudomonas sp. JM0905a]MBD2837688.1 hypothetical protein [Pseudomonas sp. JM0905a]